MEISQVWIGRKLLKGCKTFNGSDTPKESLTVWRRDHYFPSDFFIDSKNPEEAFDFSDAFFDIKHFREKIFSLKFTYFFDKEIRILKFFLHEVDYFFSNVRLDFKPRHLVDFARVFHYTEFFVGGW